MWSVRFTGIHHLPLQRLILRLIVRCDPYRNLLFYLKLIKRLNIKFAITAISRSPKSNFASHISYFIWVQHFFFCSTFQDRSQASWRDFSRRYKSQTQANIRRSAWITIPIAMSLASFASLALFVPRNPQALRWKPGDWHDAKKKKQEDPNKHGRNTVFPVFLSSIQRIKIFGGWDPGGCKSNSTDFNQQILYEL